MHVLHWMTERVDGRGPWKADFDYRLEVAATHGHLDVVKWFFERGTEWHTFEKTGKCSKGNIEQYWLYDHCTADALNLAAEHGHLEVVKWIYGARTDTCIRDCSPMSKAIANGHLAIAQWLHIASSEECSTQAMNTAAKNGHLEVLQWLDANHLFRCTKPAMELASENGHLEVVRRLHQVHHECCSSGALRRAANSGDLELVEWLYANVHIKCHCTDPYMYLYTTTAASRGYLDVLKWTHEHFPASFRSDDMDATASNRRMDVITWLHENRREGCTAFAAYGAARNGHLEVLKWLITHYPSTFVVGLSDIVNRAAENGHLEVVRWLHETRPERCSDLALYFAAAEGHLDTFLYLLEHRSEDFSSDIFRDARDIQVLCHFGPDVRGTRRSNRATNDQLKMLQNIFEQRPALVRDWLQYVAHLACSRGNVAILDWVNQFGIELNSTKPIRDAASRGDVNMLQWFLKNGFEITDPSLLEMAVLTGRLEVVHWLTKHGYDVNSLKLTAVGYNIPILRRLVEHGSPLDLSTATKLVLENHHIEIAWWVSEDDRRHLVLEALHKNDRNVVWWILAHTKFQDESARRSISDAIRCCSKDTQKWIEASMSEVEACRWCFAMATKRQNEATGEIGVPSTKRRHHGIVF